MTATKAMKAMSALNAKKAIKTKKDMSYMRKERQMVLAGEFGQTRSGMREDDLVQDKAGKVKSKKLVNAGKSNRWIAACVAARTALNIKGFEPVKKNTPLYIKAKAFYKK